jgi:hypothetical protein
MTPRITASLFGAALALIGTAASGAEVLSANAILPGCKDALNRKSTLYNAGLCMGLVVGVAAMGNTVQFALKVNRTMIDVGQQDPSLRYALGPCALKLPTE